MAKNNIIYGTSDADSIQNGDYWENYSYPSTIMSGGGNDTIENWISNVRINCGKGNDYVYIPRDKLVIPGGQVNFADNVTIEGGKGRDTLESYGVGTVYIYSDGDGKDLIRQFNEDDTLFIKSGTWSKKKSDDVIVTVGDGKITLQNLLITSNVLNINDKNISLKKISS